MMENSAGDKIHDILPWQSALQHTDPTKRRYVHVCVCIVSVSTSLSYMLRSRTRAICEHLVSVRYKVNAPAHSYPVPNARWDLLCNLLPAYSDSIQSATCWRADLHQTRRSHQSPRAGDGSHVRIIPVYLFFISFTAAISQEIRNSHILTFTVLTP